MSNTCSIRQILATNIKKFRLEKKLTQEALANLCKCSTLAIINIEKEKAWPKDKTIEDIAKALEVRTTDFFVDTRLDDELGKIELIQESIDSIQDAVNKLMNTRKNPEYIISHKKN